MASAAPGDLARSVLHDADGRPIGDLAIPDLGHQLDHALAVRRSHLHEVLLTAVRDRPAIATRFGAEVIGVRPAPGRPPPRP